MMSDIRARVDVLCPDHEATRHLATYIDRHSVGDGVVGITLRLPVRMFINRRTPLERRVLATLSPLHSSTDPHQTYSVDLTHKSGRMSPYFSGALAIHTSKADDRVGFVLAGHYDPPAGFIDTLFDATFGHRIAQATASDLLRTIATYVELASARGEAARADKSAHRSGSAPAASASP